MGRWGPLIVTFGLLTASLAPSAFAGQMLTLPKDPQNYLTLVSPAMPGAPIDEEGSPLLNAPIQIITLKSRKALLRSPANAHRARMAAEHIRLHMTNPAGILYYPQPDHLPLYVEKSNLEL